MSAYNQTILANVLTSDVFAGSEEETKSIRDNTTMTAGGDLYCNYGDCGSANDCEGNFCACFFFKCGCADGSPGTICDAGKSKGPSI